MTLCNHLDRGPVQTWRCTGPSAKQYTGNVSQQFKGVPLPKHYHIIWASRQLVNNWCRSLLCDGAQVGDRRLCSVGMSRWRQRQETERLTFDSSEDSAALYQGRTHRPQSCPQCGTSRTIESLSHSRAQQPNPTAIGLASVQPPHVGLIDIKVKFENNKALTHECLPALKWHFYNSFCWKKLEKSWRDVIQAIFILDRQSTRKSSLLLYFF